jgi:hypothetical protein
MTYNLEEGKKWIAENRKHLTEYLEIGNNESVSEKFLIITKCEILFRFTLNASINFFH